MRVVLDTNVIVSALISRGPPHQIVDAWRQGRIMVLVSVALLTEYNRAVHYPRVRRAHGLSDEELHRFVGGFLRYAELILPTGTVAVVANDPDDNRVLECAESGGATHIVSGDPHLLALDVFQGIPILTPRDFLDELDAETSNG